MITSIDRSTVSTTGTLPSGIMLFQDSYPLKVLEQKILSEDVAGTKRPIFKITGIFQKADEANANGRVYPRKVLAEAVKRISEDVDKRCVMGEYDHPTDAKIHLDRVSHLITKVWMEGKYVYGEAEILTDMPCGAMLAALFKNKCQVGISSRGVGDMETFTEGANERYRVLDGYQFVTWDAVCEPSVQEAVLSVMESRNRVLTRAHREATNPQAALITEINKWLRGDK